MTTKKLAEFTNQDFWNLAIEKYRVSKSLRKLLKKGNHFNFKQLSEILNVDRHYIYQVLIMTIKPNKEFLSKLKELENAKNNQL